VQHLDLDNNFEAALLISGFQETEASRIQENRYMKVVRLLALRTGHLYPAENIQVTYLC